LIEKEKYKEREKAFEKEKERGDLERV